MLKEIDNSAAVDYLTQKKRAKISRSFFFEGKKKKNVYFYQLQGEMIYRVKHLEMLFIFHHYCQTSVVLKALWWDHSTKVSITNKQRITINLCSLLPYKIIF